MGPALALGGSALLGGIMGGMGGGGIKLTPEQEMANKLRSDIMKYDVENTGQGDLTKAAMLSAYGFNPDISPALSYTTDLLSGKYMNGNPYADQFFDRASSKVRQKLDSQFTMAGRPNSDAHANAMADAYNDLATDIYGRVYDQERGYMDNAARMLPGLQSAQLANISGLLGLGSAQDEMAFDNANFDYNILKDKLMAMGVGPQSPTQPTENKMAGILGGALSGLQLGSGLMGAFGGAGGGIMNPAGTPSGYGGRGGVRG